mmetsp:Transcript_16748/g.33419  ORF Transcript_16748/g.33419 Transcript_16748/m.33419 type:complete len:175 (-) Transcript_16748:819-1343(-)
MPPTYPNLDHSCFFFSAQSSSTPSASALTRLPPTTHGLLTQTFSLPDYKAEREVVEREEERLRREDAKRRATSSSGSAGRRLSGGGGGGGAPRPPDQQEAKDDRRASDVSAEEDRLNQELQRSATSADPQAQVRRAMLSRMKSLTLAEDGVCEEYLREAGYDLEKAVQTFYSKN